MKAAERNMMQGEAAAGGNASSRARKQPKGGGRGGSGAVGDIRGRSKSMKKLFGERKKYKKRLGLVTGSKDDKWYIIFDGFWWILVCGSNFF